MNRVLFCSSPLQVINCRSAMDSMPADNFVKDYVVICHPLIDDKSKNIIYEISAKMKFENVFDLTHLFNKSIIGKGAYSDTSILGKGNIYAKFFHLKKKIKNKMDNHIKAEMEIKRILEEKIGHISSIFIRNDYKYFETIYMNTQKHAKSYAIEDGFGDYIPKYWAIKNINIYEIRLHSRLRLLSYILFILALAISRDYQLSKEVFLNYKKKHTKSFSNIEKKVSCCTKDNFIKNMQIISNNQKSNSDIKALIVGSIITNPKWNLNIEREVEIYNHTVEIIQKKYNLKMNEIWYKHHPRLDIDNWKYKKSNLKCSMFDYDDNVISDSLLFNKYLKSVFSVGSTTLLYAKKIFNLDSYFIDLREEKGHPSFFKKSYFLAKKYDLDILDIN